MGFNSVPAMVPQKDQVAYDCGAVVMKLSRRGSFNQTDSHAGGLRERHRGVAATGGSTNAVLHLLAIAREAGALLHIDDFQKISERTPLLADLKPSGRFVAADMHRAGGIALVVKRMMESAISQGIR